MQVGDLQQQPASSCFLLRVHPNLQCRTGQVTRLLHQAAVPGYACLLQQF